MLGSKRVLGEQEEQGLSVQCLGLSVPRCQCVVSQYKPSRLQQAQLFLQRNWQKGPLVCNSQKVATDKYLLFLLPSLLILQTYRYGCHKLAIPLSFLVLPLPLGHIVPMICQWSVLWKIGLTTSSLPAGAVTHLPKHCSGGHRCFAQCSLWYFVPCSLQHFESQLGLGFKTYRFQRDIHVSDCPGTQLDCLFKK